MLTKKTCLALACVLGLAARASQSGETATAAPELVGLGTISTPENELNSAFSPDGRTMYFTRTAGANGRFGVILMSKDLRAPVVASFSGRYSDYDPIVSPDSVSPDGW